MRFALPLFEGLLNAFPSEGSGWVLFCTDYGCGIGPSINRLEWSRGVSYSVINYYRNHQGILLLFDQSP